MAQARAARSAPYSPLDPRLSPYAAPAARPGDSRAKATLKRQKSKETLRSPAPSPSQPATADSCEEFSPPRESQNCSIQDSPPGRSPRVQMLIKQLEAGSRQPSLTQLHEQGSSESADREDGARQVSVGLNNLGNTCFMNSALQCVLHIEPLMNYFLRGSYKRDLNTQSLTKGCVASSFAHLLTEMSRVAAGTRINPLQFQKAICIFAPHLLDEQQQDCQEFLRFFLDGLSDDLFRRAKRPTEAAENKRNAIMDSIARRGGSSSKMDVDKRADPPIGGLNTQMSATAPFGKQSAGNMDTNDALVESAPAQRPKSSVARLRSITNSSRKDDPQAVQDPSESTIDSLVVVIAPTMGVPARPAASSGMAQHDDDISLDGSLSPVGNSPAASADAHDSYLKDSLEVHGRSICGLDLADSMEMTLDLSVENLTVSDSTAKINETEGSKAVALKVSVKEDRPQLNELINSQELSSVVQSARRNERSSSGDSSATENNDILDAKFRLIAEKAALESWKNFLNHNDSIITDLFFGQLQNTVECLECHHRSVAFDPFMDLSVPIPSSSSPSDGSGSKTSVWKRRLVAATGRRSGNCEYPTKCTLEDCIEKFTADEILEGDNMYTCEKCEKRQRCLRKLSIYKCPEILVIHIKRFQYTSIVREKLFTDVQFPLTGLDIKPFLSSSTVDPFSANCTKSTIYDLSGVVHHSGGINGGHYVAHVASTTAEADCTNNNNANNANGISIPRRKSLDDAAISWTCFNDAHVSPISEKHIAGPSAYVLFYKLRK